jgi:hypothetical protein
MKINVDLVIDTTEVELKIIIIYEFKFKLFNKSILFLKQNNVFFYIFFKSISKL